MLFVLSAVLAAGMWSATASAITIIDHFDDPDPGPTYTAYSPGHETKFATLSGLDVLGGTRDTTLELISANGKVELSINDLSLGGSRAALSCWSQSQGRAIFEYNGGGILDADLSNEIQFVAKVTNGDHTGGILKVSVNGSAPVSVSLPVGGLTAVIPFTSPEFASVNFQHVHDIKFQIDGPVAYQVELHYFAADSIPLPASAWAGGALLGLLAFAKIRRLARA
jgi:hypothetical protein